MKILYKKFAKYYDLCYSKKDYLKETKFLNHLIKINHIKGKKILDVGCGTGNHDIYMEKQGFSITGIDLNQEMLNIARKKNDSIKWLQGDMKTFNIHKKFDIIICLFSTIHYNLDYKELKKTLTNFFKHLKKNGLLIFDMGFNEERWKTGHIHLKHWSNNSIHLIRFSKTKRKGKYGFLNMAYILYKKNKFYFKKEKHKIRIFETLKIRNLIKSMGHKVNLYENYTNKKWNSKSKKYVIFSCIKK